MHAATPLLSHAPHAARPRPLVTSAPPWWLRWAAGRQRSQTARRVSCWLRFAVASLRRVFRARLTWPEQSCTDVWASRLSPRACLERCAALSRPHLLLLAASKLEAPAKTATPRSPPCCRWRGACGANRVALAAVCKCIALPHTFLAGSTTFRRTSLTATSRRPPTRARRTTWR